MSEQMPYFQRLKEFRKAKKISQQVVADAVGLAKSTISDLENGKSAVSIENLKAICSAIGADIGFIMTGKEYGSTEQPKALAEPLVIYKTKDQMPAVVTVDSLGRDNVPLVHVKARAGYLAGYADPEFIAELPAYRLPNINHGTYRMFEVGGHSMNPTLHQGDIVITEWVENPSQMRDERIYVLVTHDEGILIKRCINRVNNPEMGFILAKSDNTIKQANKEEYPNIPVYASQIKEIWYARWYMSSQFTAPSDLYHRLTNLEAEMEAFKQTVRQLNK